MTIHEAQSICPNLVKVQADLQKYRYYSTVVRKIYEEYTDKIEPFGIDEAWLTLGREVKARGLTPAGAPRVLGIVAPYTGREIETRRYCTRLVLPIME